MRGAVGLMYAISTVLSALAVHMSGVSPLAYAGVAAFAAHCAWQVATIAPADKDRVADTGSGDGACTETSAAGRPSHRASPPYRTARGTFSLRMRRQAPDFTQDA